MRRILSAILLALVSPLLVMSQGQPKIKVLILTGVNNHDWRATTPALREILERTGRFEVYINEEVRGNTLRDL